MTAPTTTPDFLALIRRSGLCDERQLDEFLSRPTVMMVSDNPQHLAAALIRGGLLTVFQAKQLLAGRARGFHLGPFVIKDQLGKGGMGAVFLAVHTALNRKVALKVLQPNDSAQHSAVERFLREARAAAALDHPNIVQLYDIGQSGRVHYIALEYVDGRTLHHIVKQNGRQPVVRVAGWAMQVAAGLDHAWSKGLVHRDIKPGNLMVRKDGVLKILDMGLAKSADRGDDLTAILDKGAIVGTVDYISPEQARGAQVDIRGDIYSLGATMFTALTGRTLFEGSPGKRLMQHQLSRPPALTALVPGCPPEFAAIVECMLAKRPEDRFQTPRELIIALRPWADPSGLPLPHRNHGASLANSDTDSPIPSAMTALLHRPKFGG